MSRRLGPPFPPERARAACKGTAQDMRKSPRHVLLIPLFPASRLLGLGRSLCPPDAYLAPWRERGCPNV